MPEAQTQIVAELTAIQREALRLLRDADRLSLRRIFHCSSVPPLTEAAGDFDAELLDQGGLLSNVIVGSAFGLHGNWIGKAFHPVSPTTGIGHNCFLNDGRLVRKLPMDTAVTKSSLDDWPAMTIDYRSKNRGLVRWLRGEARQVTPGIWLGLGIFGLPVGRRDRWRRIIPFVLVGPRCEISHQDQAA
jgi:hypothetical protein